MFVVRDQQLATLEQAARRAFEDRLVAIIAADYPAGYQSLQEPGARRIAAHAIDLGATHGIVTEGGVIALAGLMVQYGESFERSPDQVWAQGILTKPRLPEQLKVQFLLERMAGRSQGRVVVAQDGA